MMYTIFNQRSFYQKIHFCDIFVNPLEENYLLIINLFIKSVYDKIDPRHKKYWIL
jgi:hypothetical protein